MTTWTIATLERDIQPADMDGAVVVAHWRATDSETVGEGDDAVTYSASSYGTVGFTPDPTASDYIAYDSLTEADVLGWVWESVGQDTVEAALTAKIEAEKNPTTADGVPW
jgi:hypothetical protein